MKNLILAILLSIFTPIPSLGGDSTNGVFYVNNPVECRLIAQSGVTITNYLSAGKTYMVRDALLELEITNKTIFYFSGGLTIESGKGSLIGINVFDQEVNNLNAAPRLAEFGNQNIGFTNSFKTNATYRHFL